MSYLRSIYLMVALAAMMGLAAAGSFTAMMDIDTYVDSSKPDTPLYDADNVWASSSGGNPEKIAYLGFKNNFGNIGLTSPDMVEFASLRLKATDVVTPGKVTAYFMKGAALATWTWNTNRDPYDESAKVEFDVVASGDVTLDITPLIKKAVTACTTGCPYSVVLVAKGDAKVAFASTESDPTATELKFSMSG